MMLRFISCIVVLGLSSIANAEDPPGLVKSTKGQCQIAFPSKPKSKIEKDSEEYILEVENGNAGYIFRIEYMDKKNDLQGEAMVKKVLDEATKAMRSSMKGKIANSTKSTITAKKYPLRNFDLEVPDIGLMRNRMVLTSDAIYIVSTFGPKEWANHADRTAFINSLGFVIKK